MQRIGPTSWRSPGTGWRRSRLPPGERHSAAHRGWSFAEIAEALFIDDSTIRIWLKEFQEGGVEGLVLFDLKGGAGALSPLQIDELRAWATRVLPTSTTEVGQFIKERFGVDYGRSGLIKLMNRIGFDWRKPESVPDRIDAETQQKFIDAHGDLRNSLGPDEAVVYVDAVHPTHQAKPSGRWLPRGQRCALPAASGRDRLNLHGAIDLETGLTRIMDVQTVDAASTIALFEALERAYPAMRRIHVFLDNARYHHARAVRDWLQQPGRRIVLHFVPSYCPHLNPIERLWKVMHEHVTHNKCYAKFRDFAGAVLDFLRETVPRRLQVTPVTRFAPLYDHEVGFPSGSTVAMRLFCASKTWVVTLANGSSSAFALPAASY